MSVRLDWSEDLDTPTSVCDAEPDAVEGHADGCPVCGAPADAHSATFRPA